VFIVTVPNVRALHSAGVPHLYFPCYTREQSLHILAKSPMPVFPSGRADKDALTPEEDAEETNFVWTRFCSVVWDSLGKEAARDIVSLRNVAGRLWGPFCAPIIDGTYGTRDFSKLLISKRTLFQGEAALVDRLVVETPKPLATQPSQTSTPKLNVASMSINVSQVKDKHNQTDWRVVHHQLTYYSKYILCAAYLASYNPARQDSTYFMKAAERRQRKGGGGVRGRPPKNRKVSYS